MFSWRGPMTIALSVGAMLAGSCAGGQPVSSAAGSSPATKKIAFDLSRLNEEGLIGPPDGLRALAYEFCVPARPATLIAVERIDPTVRTSSSPGRIGCGADEALCIGHTHQANWRAVLETLAELEFVVRIEEWVGE